MFNGIGDVSVKDFLKQMYSLKKYGLNNGVVCKTSDEARIQDADAFLFIDMPERGDVYFQKAIVTGKPVFLLAWESGMINPRNLDIQFHEPFKKIFTYDDSLVDNKKYIKIGYPFEFPHAVLGEFDGKKLCCLIVSNKVSSHPLELYSYRLELVKYLEIKHPSDFDLYGQGWNKIIPPKNIIQRIINKFDFLNEHFGTSHPSYRGVVNDKMEIYQRYKFAICYENARDLPGYISEKIFDCLFSGCVPIYWGAPNISEYIPESCYIDRRQFESNDELYSYLSQMRREKYFQYIDAINNFLQEAKSGIFSLAYFTETVVKNIFSKQE